MNAPSQSQTLNPYFMSSHSESHGYTQTYTAEVSTRNSNSDGATEFTSPVGSSTTSLLGINTVLESTVSSSVYNDTSTILGHENYDNLSSTLRLDLQTDINPNQDLVGTINAVNSSIQSTTSTSTAFTLHVYVFTAFFLSIDLFIVFVCLTSSKRKVLHRPTNMGVLLLNVIFSTNFAILLLGDPYGYSDLFPSIVITFIFYFKYLCFVVSFWLIQVILKSLSSLKQVDPGSRLRRYRAFAFLCLGYACVMTATGVTTCEKPNLQALHLIPQAIYVTAMIVLCFTFLYSALNISQYTKQTCRVLDESITYSKMQSHLKENGRHADACLDLYRVKRGKLGYEVDFSPDDLGNYYPNGNLCNDSESSSNDSLTFCNKVAFTETGNIEKIFEQRKNGFRKKQNFLPSKKEYPENNSSTRSNHPTQHYAILESTSECGFSTDDSEILSPCDRLDKANPIYVPQKNTCPVKLKMNKVPDRSTTTVFCNNSFSFDHHRAITSAEINHECGNQEDYIDPELDKRVFNGKQSLGRNSDTITDYQCKTHLLDKCRAISKTAVIKLINNENKHEDNGYLADTENAVVDDGIDVDEVQVSMEEVVIGPSDNNTSNGGRTSPLQQSLPSLPVRSGNYLGLQRARRGRCVRRVMQTTYCTAIFAFLLCVLELYEMFSVRGVLTGLDSSTQFTWLLFQSFMRFSELGFSTTVIRSVQMLGRKRRTPHQRKAIQKPVYLMNGHQCSPSSRDSGQPSTQPLCSAETSPL